MKNLKRYLLALVLFFLVLSVSFSDVVLTDEEYDQIMEALNNSEQELKTQKLLLQEALNELNQLEKDWNQLQEIMTQQSMAFEMLKKSLEMQKNDQFLKNLEWFLLGFAGGGFAGFTIGVKIQI